MAVTFVEGDVLVSRWTGVAVDFGDGPRAVRPDSPAAFLWNLGE